MTRALLTAAALVLLGFESPYPPAVQRCRHSCADHHLSCTDACARRSHADVTACAHDCSGRFDRCLRACSPG
jgi:hypothetical protein